ncbi:MAG: glycerol-3-phosphate 1-O-acyltransferase PlsY [Chloroflexota bacterium]|nr:glycerol-3-phosphate 1-O-acyltransferase PlsY [Chloroflexota bacterium]
MSTLSVVVVVSGYLLGSIPVGLLAVRATTGKDVREVGSGRIGATNTLRAAGIWVALLTILGDGAKGLLAVYLARAVVGIPVVEALAGLAAVVGHNYSIFIGFKGGAGTMTTVGGAIGLWPWNGAILLGVGAVLIAVTRHASIASITMALLLPAVFALRAWLGGEPWVYLIHGLGTAALTLWALRPNIRRLLDGNERQVTLRKKA